MTRVLPGYATAKITVAAIALAIGLGFAAHVAFANHYHTNCVGHGFVHGSSTNDGSFFARVEGGCGNPGAKACVLYYYGSPYGSSSWVPSGNGATCDAWSIYGGTECGGSAHVDFDSVFVSHEHLAHNWCG
jgi:hypothetical protein